MEPGLSVQRFLAAEVVIDRSDIRSRRRANIRDGGIPESFFEKNPVGRGKEQATGSGGIFSLFIHNHLLQEGDLSKCEFKISILIIQFKFC
jgi:hypothetical protein